LSVMVTALYYYAIHYKIQLLEAIHYIDGILKINDIRYNKSVVICC
jgi:hypothetical protein